MRGVANSVGRAHRSSGKMAKQVRRVRRKRHRNRPVPILKGRKAIYIGAVVLASGSRSPLAAPMGLAPTAVGTRRACSSAPPFSWKTSNSMRPRGAAQQILKLRPDSLPAFQIMADATEKQNRPETVAWRAQIAAPPSGKSGCATKPRLRGASFRTTRHRPPRARKRSGARS